MNKFFKMDNGVPALVILFAILLSACNSGGKSVKSEGATFRATRDNAALYDDLKKAEKIFYTLPSPLESAMLIKSAGALFDNTILNPVDNAKNYSTNRSMALNLGIFTCDLSFVSLYDQTQMIIDYMNAAKKMADGLGILDAISEEDISKLEENIHNQEVIMEIISQTYLNSNSYLEDNGQPAIAAMVLTGGWIEGLYLSTKLVSPKDIATNKLAGRIVDQKLSIDNLMSMLTGNKGNPAIDDILVQMERVKAVFDKITITTTDIKPEYSEAERLTLLRSQAKSNLTVEVFRELSSVVTEIRNSFVK
ncbi:MAG TPA: hypothetical protein PKL65_12670 [Bacteroidales bacterium]|nr:hypothetical protein [Bacteroidales bacterium]HNR43078.1 hypothetical protein [Bacteroidales bacterium]HQG78378.1 hypothetical protein [Bacteroidales bacterium]